MKTTRVGYITFRRISGPPHETGFLLVPEFLMNMTYNPFRYSEYVNGTEICRLENNALVADQELTKRELAVAADRSPKIMGTSRPEGGVAKLFVKSGMDRLSYSEYNGGLIEPSSRGDYACKGEVAARYVGIIYKNLKKLVDSRDIGIYIAYAPDAKHSLKLKRNIELFLLEELNRLKA